MHLFGCTIFIQNVWAHAFAEAKCPECGTELLVARITPVLFVGEFEELGLACKTCSFTKTIKIKRA
jgi:C4-type Zn-finger protein